MADINLLGSEKKEFHFSERGFSWLARLMVVVVVAILAYYGYLFYASHKVQGQIDSLRTKTQTAQADAVSNKDRAQLLTRQGQLASLNPLIKNHTYWSALLPEVARVTLKQASYVTMQADSSGTMVLTVSVPDYASMDKFLQVFDMSQYNQQFKDVKILSINKSQEASNLNLNLRIQLSFNPDFIKNPNP